jgi:hypothetical protein
MKQDAVNGRQDPRQGQRDGQDPPAQRVERGGLAEPESQQAFALWPAEWAWEEDNDADGLGVGPFPGQRKPPQRAHRRPPAGVVEDPELSEDPSQDD